MMVIKCQKIVRHVGTAIDEDELIKLKNLAEYIKIKLKTQHQGSLFSPELTVKEIIENKDKSDQTRKEPLHTDLKHMKSNA
ncbi:MAG: hypothetical protein OXD32_04140 [Endozoicomonadaceae bacterium]|nr:hypothetical protein [Endozoicomonadaceae bacterium]